MNAGDNVPRQATDEELELVTATLRTAPRPVISIARELGWPTLRASMALLELWQRGRAEVDVSEPYGWRLT